MRAADENVHVATINTLNVTVAELIISTLNVITMKVSPAYFVVFTDSRCVVHIVTTEVEAVSIQNLGVVRAVLLKTREEKTEKEGPDRRGSDKKRLRK